MMELAPFEEWERFAKSLQPIGRPILAKLIGAQDAAVRQDAAHALLMGLIQGYITHVYADPDYPEFVPALGLPWNLGAPVPDFAYRVCPLAGGGTYRLAGNRGTSLFADLNISQGYWAAGTPGGTLNNYNLDDLQVAADGTFDVILSAERPTGHTGDWWYLDPRARRGAMRRAAYDWLNEIDPRVTIERLDLPAARPRPAPDRIAGRMADLGAWAERVVAIWLEHIRREWDAGKINRLEYQDYKSTAGSSLARGQVYIEGFYDLMPDEALLIDTELPEISRYWSFLVTDEIWGTLNWMHRFSSINGFQARLSSDGRFRAIVSAADPGIPNWLDISGYRRGMIQGRWNNASSAPMPVCTRIKLAEVQAHMPADTPGVSPEERDRLLRLRRKGAQMRGFW